MSKTSPGLAGTASAALVGNAIHDEVTVSGGFSPTGEVTFSVYAPADVGCLTPLETDVVALQAGDATSGNFTAQQAGEFRWTATYSGDENNESVSLPCGAPNQASAVSKDSPSLDGTATLAVVVGSSITDNATLAGGFAPGGQIVFRAFGPGDLNCEGTVQYEETVAVSGNGVYSPAGFSPPAGLYRWTAAYSGDGNNEGISLPCGAPDQSSTVVSASPSLEGAATSAVVGSAITDSVTLSGGFAAGGELVFRAFGPGDTNCTGTVQYQEAVAVSGNGVYSPAGFSPPAGSYRWTAAYSGDSNNNAVSLPCNAANQSSTVSKATPSIEGAATSVTVGSSITDNVTVAGGFTPGGQILFRAFGPGDTDCTGPIQYEETVAVSGNGVYSPAGFSPPAGSYLWTASYSGDANNNGASLPCNSVNQTSTVAKATPSLAGVATSTVIVGSPITDSVTLTGGFQAGGQIVFRAFGPGNATCSGAAIYEATVPVNNDGVYSPTGFKPPAGLYRWTAAYSGDGNNEAVTLACGATNQASAVGTITVTLSAAATGGTVGDPVTATAVIQNGAIPRGQITFKAFPPGDANCSGPAAFSSTVSISGVGSYHSTIFVPSRVGTYRWTVSYSGDPNHAPATAGCGEATSSASQARPSITSRVEGRLVVGRPFSVSATLQGGYVPAGTVSFQIYDPTAAACAKPFAVNTVAIARNGTAHSDPFVPKRPGRYSFVASYSGDSANQGATESCDPSARAADVSKRTPKVKPHARLKGGNLISIRAQLSGAVSPTGVVNFRLYRPGDKRCKDKPAFNGGLSVRANGSYLLAEYLAGKSGIYRLSVGYSGDQRNRRYTGSCGGAQTIRIG